ncbi:hypothetical protein A3I48_00740 [Candidatus Daviesbacteria bacterium RIFCSPLOWO2_02_FULL_36_7]|uniref:NAD(+) kinase n=1 Tax=Candidatus Daviesbacteria bacterium RIFCSPLOWO2_02_FULL_36_7 TaxID=1797792 RepID=A0A1F5MHT4_9BACT|nr:MAG: hypothetical protein A3I48_00740 [Candidatus Daviesbacteria bacterium RIFCSPLOWO2_02_FULL_36_7]
MKVLLYGKNSKNIESLVKTLGFEIVTSEPDLIISYGGDGTLLSCEREYPCIPKLPIRNSQVCIKCINHEDKIVLEKLLKWKLKLQNHQKLQTTFLYKTFYALNDFVVRNSDSVHTTRFKINGGKLLIGDGIVVATPFGSSGYYKSIARQTFQEGFGVAFNNTIEEMPPLILKEKDLINFQLIRGKATLSYDNSPEIFTIDEGSQLQFKLSDQVAKIYTDTSLRCPNCKITSD